jgi:hypothetical protein|tara:strand:+ start:3789 stop:4211 length:423 start_codon:yes stop_codon:yes gene_type:complete
VIKSSFRSGYTFLLAVLFIGAISIAVTGTMLLLSWVSMHNVEIMENSGKGYELAMTCTEHALLELFEDFTYAGNEEITESNGTCFVLPIGGAGYENRTLCIESESGNTIRRFETILKRVLPSIEVAAWQEVEVFTSCSYE